MLSLAASVLVVIGISVSVMRYTPEHDLSADVAPVRYVGKCEIDQQDGVHMVLQGQKGPVTVMLMPYRQVDARIAIADQRFQGSIEPMARGSLAIIAEQGEPVDELIRSLHNGLQWRFQVYSIFIASICIAELSISGRFFSCAI